MLQVRYIFLSKVTISGFSTCEKLRFPAITMPDSETFVPEFGLNYPQFYLDFRSQHLSQTSEFHIDEQTSFLDPLSEREGSDSDFDNWEVFDVGPLPAHAAQTQPKGNAGSDHNQLPKRRGRKTNSTFTRPPHGELG